MQPQQIPVQTTAPTYKKPMSTSAITGLILSIIAFLMVMLIIATPLAPFLTFIELIAAVAGLVCSIVGAVSCRATGVRRGMAISVWGIVIALIAIFLGFMVPIIGV